MVLAATANLFLRKGMQTPARQGKPLGLFGTAVHAIRSVNVWLGGLTYIVAMACWLYVLKNTEIGLAYPIFAGGSSVCVVFASMIFLGERPEVRRIVGALLMIAGIFVSSIEF